MALLGILIFPDPRLKKVAAQAQPQDPAIKQIIADMLETMYQADGIGLAATQVNIQKRIIVIDISDNRKTPLFFINPVITKQGGEVIWEEGCLSFPDIYVKVKRFATITVTYQDLNGDSQEIAADSLLSVCLQHEIDHLNGVTLYDRISLLKRNLLKKRLKNLGKA